jgi:multifunctional 2-oxoglutarate metabolism enzyme
MAVNTTIQVVMPQMGESVTEGTVLSWFKQEGEEIAADEPLVEISTDKIDAEVPSPGAGTLVKLHVAEGDTVTVGQVLAEIAPGNGAGPSHAHESGNGTAVQEAPTSDDAGGTGEILEIVMPQMGESVSEGTILDWAKGPGDAVAADETIVEISTDKVDAEVPSPASGTITEVLAAAGDTVTVGQVLARMQVGAGSPRVSAPSPPEAPQAAPGPAGNGAAVPADATISPVARRMASVEGVDLSRVAGSGPGGRITKADVLAAKSNGGGAVVAATAPAGAPA